MHRIRISGPVGNLSITRIKGNIPVDVKKVKTLLQELELLPRSVRESETIPELIVSIKRFQSSFMIKPDGRINKKGKTLIKLNTLTIGRVIIVDLKQQILCAYRNGTRIHRFNCLTGRATKPTRKGWYRIYWKSKDHINKQEAPMPYAMFFYKPQGLAIHQGYISLRGRRLVGDQSLGSSGCVRLKESNAKTLYRKTPRKTRIVIF